MKFNPVLIIALLILFALPISAQKTYFFKYKSNVPIDVVELNISEQKLSSTMIDRPVSLPQFNIDYLAKGLGRGDEVLGRIVKVQFTQDVDESILNEILLSDPDFEYIQKSNTYQLDFVPDDPSLYKQWALEKIKAFDAWDITQGTDTVLLAIIDTGIEFFHPDLKNKIYKNPGEMGTDNQGRDKSSNGIDDDNNGFIDDYMGWDFVDRVGFPLDTTAGDFLIWDNYPYDPIPGNYGFHGTFVAGIAGAETNNSIDLAGAAPNIKLLNLRCFENGGGGEEDDAASAILYAVKMGAKVINMSWGDYSFSYVLRDVIRYAYSQNVILVASSGNSSSSTNINSPHYPSGYTEVISVGNSTPNDYRSSNSVYGSTLDLMAPGTDIFSTNVGGDTITAGGTSAAAPFVSSTAALILSLQNFNNEEVKQILKSTTDDIGTPGWDIQTGAGRLNMERALRVLAPSNIKFNFPLMDFATSADTLPIVATILSANFISYNLQIGSGIEPDSWMDLIQNGLNQFTEKEIYKLDISNYNEGRYTLRITINSNNGRTMEERVIFHIMRTPPQVVEVGLGPIYYGDRSTIAGEFYSNQPSIMKMYYRRFGETNFNFISLDGFNTNNQFVKEYHYGFIPKEIVLPSTNYEVYFEAENLAGLKTIVVDSANNNNYFQIKTEDVPQLVQYNQLDFSLPKGVLYPPYPVSFLSENKNEVLFQTFYENKNAIFSNYVLENNSFVRNTSDSLTNRYPRFYGDFNNNGLKDLLVANNQYITSLEQTNANSFIFTKKDSSDKLFLSILVEDLLNDGNHYLITENFPDKKLSRYLLWQINSDLMTTFKDTIYISYNDSFGSHYTSEQMVVDDIDSDGNKEIWFLDSGGNLKSYKVNSNLTFTKSDSFYTSGSGFRTPSGADILSIGNYDGVGNKDIAILYRTNSIAPTYFLLIISFENHSPRLITQKVFLDQSDEYRGGLSSNDFYTSLKFVDIDNDGRDELVLNMFPYTYIFKHSSDGDKIVFYKEDSNTEHTFVGDLNQNGVKEIGLYINERTEFFEFSNSNRTIVPGLIKGFSISSTTIQLDWISDAPKFYIYRGLERTNMELVDSSSAPAYFDSNVALDSTYFYAVKAYDPSNPEPLSGMSNIVEVYAHTPAKPTSAVSNSNRSVIVIFSEKMKNTIENLQAFNIVGVGYPNSVTANDQYSYLLSYTVNLPEGNQKLIVQNIKDFYNSPISSDSLIFTVTQKPEIETFYVASFEILNAYKIKLVFNFDVDATSAINPNNYTFDPLNKVTSVAVDPNDTKIVYLDLSNQKPVGSIGKEYVLRISNIVSNSATGNIPINTGAGSYIVLSTYAKDLSDVYVYPNPTKAGTNKVTFANLPQKAKITIWSIDGMLLNEIEETDGNGGVDYYLNDFGGNQISSGVYIYRIVQLNDQNNEGEEKLGKFAIVR